MYHGNEIPVLDLRNCGIGNVVLLAATHLIECVKLGALPVVLHDNPAELGVLDLEYFALITDPKFVDPSTMRYVKPEKFCNLNALGDPQVKRCMGDIVLRRDDVPDMQDVEAGFCFRVSKSGLDGTNEFMNDTATRRMMREMSAYKKVFVCGNDRDIVHEAVASHPNAVCVPIRDEDTRNADSHIVQWHALSRCPVVYHGVRKRGVGRTSTFAPVAAAFGVASTDTRVRVVGIDNFGDDYEGENYAWS